MNRRELIKLSAQGILGTAGIVLGLKTASASCYDASRLRTVFRMVKESGEMWLAVRDRESGGQPIFISFGDDAGYELNRKNGRWVVDAHKFSKVEMRQFEQYLIKNPHLPTRIGDKIFNNMRIRAWVKNGRRPDWIMSCDHNSHT